MSATSTINVGAIEKELTSLWKQASEDETGGVVRASILNLIVFVPDPAEIAAVDDIVIDVTASHPCRVIALVADRASEESKLTADADLEAGLLRAGDDYRQSGSSGRSAERHRAAADCRPAGLSLVAR